MRQVQLSVLLEAPLYQRSQLLEPHTERRPTSRSRANTERERLGCVGEAKSMGSFEEGHDAETKHAAEQGEAICCGIVSGDGDIEEDGER